jgi:DNA replication protein DnaC
MTDGQHSPESSDLDSRTEADVRNFNGTAGSLPDYDCPECKNRGEIGVNRNGAFMTYDCECKIIRRNIICIRESGLADLLGIYTFDNYTADLDWQKYVKERAAAYVAESGGHWLSVLGCIGAGKTHICTAVCGELMKTGVSLKYMLWRDESVKLKAMANNYAEYSQCIAPFKDAEILYIDDLFKTKKGAELTPADINLAFELINYRYNSLGRKTIISSEKSIAELYDTDPAIGTRIYEKSKKHDFCLEIENTTENNYRLR